jgi:hypothetical protein
MPIATDGFHPLVDLLPGEPVREDDAVELAGGGIGEQHAGDWDRHRDIDRCELKAVERLRVGRVQVEAPRQDPFT